MSIDTAGTSAARFAHSRIATYASRYSARLDGRILARAFAAGRLARSLAVRFTRLSRFGRRGALRRATSGWRRFAWSRRPWLLLALAHRHRPALPGQAWRGSDTPLAPAMRVDVPGSGLTAAAVLGDGLPLGKTTRALRLREAQRPRESGRLARLRHRTRAWNVDLPAGETASIKHPSPVASHSAILPARSSGGRVFSAPSRPVRTALGAAFQAASDSPSVRALGQRSLRPLALVKRTFLPQTGVFSTSSAPVPGHFRTARPLSHLLGPIAFARVLSSISPLAATLGRAHNLVQAADGEESAQTLRRAVAGRTPVFPVREIERAGGALPESRFLMPDSRTGYREAGLPALVVPQERDVFRPKPVSGWLAGTRAARLFLARLQRRVGMGIIPGRVAQPSASLNYAGGRSSSPTMLPLRTTPASSRLFRGVPQMFTKRAVLRREPTAAAQAILARLSPLRNWLIETPRSQARSLIEKTVRRRQWLSPASSQSASLAPAVFPQMPPAAELPPLPPWSRGQIPSTTIRRLELPAGKKGESAASPRVKKPRTVSSKLSGKRSQLGPPDGIRIEERGVSTQAPAEFLDTLMNAGAPGRLEHAVRMRLAPVLGFDPGIARIHHGPAAARAARALRAEAFAVGRDVFFAEGRFETRTPAGLALLAHELTHVRQQTSRQRHEMRFFTQQGGDAMEAEAQEAAAKVQAQAQAGRDSTHKGEVEQDTLLHQDAHVPRPSMAFAIPSPAARAETMPEPSQTATDQQEAGKGGPQARGADARAVAERVYDLMRDEIRLARERAGMRRAV